MLMVGNRFLLGKVVFFLFVIIGINAKAQDTTIVRNGVLAICNAMLTNDMKKIIDYTHPRVIALIGGKDKAIELTNAAMTEVRNNGMSLKDVTIGKVGQFYSSGKSVYCVVPQKISLNIKEGYVSMCSSILGISEDQGRTWKFASAGNIGIEKVKSLFPELPDGLIILPDTEPVFHKE